VTVRDDVDAQRAADRRRDEPLTLTALRSRVAAVEDAHAHQLDRNVGPFPLRQALVDLAALCEDWAVELPEPHVAGYQLKKWKAGA
jgi:hypothetical protein